ncbi:hypothetical protein BASA81_004415 [Batrachochytrium salamandrivorans]|nr:hypothetical protein BASA81_004415 [Batrachochytrium salamandrivorans]
MLLLPLLFFFLLLPPPSTASVVVSNTTQLLFQIASSASTIYLSSSSPFLLSQPLVLTRKLSLIGLGDSPVVLDMQNLTRGLELSHGATAVSLRNLHFKNGQGELPPAYTAGYSTPRGGGCISLYTTTPVGTLGSAISLQVDQCTFERCHSLTGAGGAILVYAPYLSQVTISQSIFMGNSAGVGGGGAIEFEIYSSDLTFGLALLVSDSEFVGNWVSNGNGGAIEIKSPAQNIRLMNVSLQNNQAVNGSGGALALWENLSAFNTTLMNNTAEVGNAVVLMNDYCFLEVDEFTQVQALDNGVYAPDPTLQIQRIRFTPAPFAWESTPTPTIPTTPTTRIPSAQSTRTLAPTQPAQTDTGLIAALASILAIMLLGFAAYQKRKYDLLHRIQLPTPGSDVINRLDSFAEAELAHNEQVSRRRGPSALLIEDQMLFPYDAVGDTTCPICLETSLPCTWETFNKCVNAVSRSNMDDITLQNTFCRLTTCGHMAHTACLIQWVELNARSDCPFCRTSVKANLRQRWGSSGVFSPVSAATAAAAAAAAAAVIPNDVDVESLAQTRRSAQADDLRQESGSLVISSHHSGSLQ